MQVEEERRFNAVRIEQQDGVERLKRAHAAEKKRVEQQAKLEQEAWAEDTRKRFLGAFSAGDNLSTFGTAHTDVALGQASSAGEGEECERKLQNDRGIAKMNQNALPLVTMEDAVRSGAPRFTNEEIDAYVSFRAKPVGGGGGDDEGVGGGLGLDAGTVTSARACCDVVMHACSLCGVRWGRPFPTPSCCLSVLQKFDPSDLLILALCAVTNGRNVDQTRGNFCKR